MATTSTAAGDNNRLGGVRFSVHDNGRPVSGASCTLYHVLPIAPAKKGTGQTPLGTAGQEYVDTETTGLDGQGAFARQPAGDYLVVCHHEPRPAPEAVDVEPGCTHDVCFDLALNVSMATHVQRDDCTPTDCARTGDIVELRVEYANSSTLKLKVKHPSGARVDPNDPLASRWTIPSAGLNELRFTVFSPYVAGATGAPAHAADARIEGDTSVEANDRTPTPISGNLGVALTRTGVGTVPELTRAVNLPLASESCTSCSLRLVVERVALCMVMPPASDCSSSNTGKLGNTLPVPSRTSNVTVELSVKPEPLM